MKSTDKRYPYGTYSRMKKTSLAAYTAFALLMTDHGAVLSQPLQEPAGILQQAA
jgi:hypothetical protein